MRAIPLILLFAAVVSISSASPVLEKLARIRTKTSPEDQVDAVIQMVKRLFPGRYIDFVFEVNPTHFRIKNNMDSFEYQTWDDG